MQRNNIKILFLGDIVGVIGRKVVQYYLSIYKKKEHIDFVIANGENVTHGKGLSYSHYKELISYGIDVITSGNHFFENRDVLNEDYDFDRMIRPINFDVKCPYSGSKLFIYNNVKIRVTNAIGRVFLNLAQTNPFYDIEELINKEEKTIHILDFHGEATAEKRIMAEYFDSKLTAVIGTHTHVQTNDAKLLNKGTFFLSDVGMNGEYDSILGTKKEESIERTITLLPKKFVVDEVGDGLVNGVILDVDTTDYRVTSFKLVNEIIKKETLFKRN